MERTDDLMRACHDNWSILHRLTCGHSIEAEGPHPCQSNCTSQSQLHPAWNYNAPFFICKQCIEHNVIQRIHAGHEDKFILLSTLHFYKSGSEQEKQRLRAKLTKSFKKDARMHILIIEGINEGVMKGGIQCRKAEVANSLDDLVDAMGKVEVDPSKQELVKATGNVEDLMKRLELTGESRLDVSDAMKL